MIRRVHAVDGRRVDIRVVDLEFLADEDVIDGLFFVFAFEAVVSVADFACVKALIDVCELDVVKGCLLYTSRCV